LRRTGLGNAVPTEACFVEQLKRSVLELTVTPGNGDVKGLQRDFIPCLEIRDVALAGSAAANVGSAMRSMAAAFRALRC